VVRHDFADGWDRLASQAPFEVFTEVLAAHQQLVGSYGSAAAR